MTTYNITVNLEGNAIVGCMEFTNVHDNGNEAVKRTVEAFVKSMQARSKIRMYTEEMITEALKVAIAQAPIDVFDDVRNYLNTEGDIGQRVEEQIAKASTPSVAREYDITPTVDDGKGKDTTKINLYEQHRKTLAELSKIAPKDRLIEQAIGLRKMAETGQNDPQIPIFIAALEIVYTGLPRDFWGSVKAENDIKELMKIHEGENNIG